MHKLKNLFLSLLCVCSGPSVFAAESSKLVGSWVGVCNESVGFSYKVKATFTVQAVAISSTVTFKGQGCVPGTEIQDEVQSALYSVISEDANAAIASIKIEGELDGNIVELQTRYTFKNLNQADAKVIKIRVLKDGAVVDLDQEQVDEIELVQYTRI